MVQAEQLVCHLDGRVKTLLASRLPQERYRTNFCFGWARINFSLVTAISCWCGQATDDLTNISTTDSLFGDDFSNFIVMDSDISVQGCYFLVIFKDGVLLT